MIQSLKKLLLTGTALSAALAVIVTPANAFFADDAAGVDANGAPKPFFERYAAVEEEQLDEMRGGFALPGGIIRFAVDMGALVDGTEVFSTSLVIDQTTVDIPAAIAAAEAAGMGTVGDTTGAVSIADDLSRVVSTVTGGVANVNGSLINATGVFNIVQNVQSDVTIQQFTNLSLDLQAGTLAAARSAAAMQSAIAASQSFGIR